MHNDGNEDQPRPLPRDDLRQFYGKPDARGIRVGIVCSRFNSVYTTALAENALLSLEGMGAKMRNVELVWVPGAYEIPPALRMLEDRRPADGYLALGLVVQGETRHAETIDQAIGRALMELSLRWGKPVIHEVVSVYNLQQADARCRGGEGTRGWYAARALAEMLTLYRRLEEKAL